MALSIPTLPELIARARAGFRAELPGSDAWIWPNNVTPTAKVVAGAIHEVFGKLAWGMEQLFASTATSEAWLVRHAEDMGLSRRPAAAAGGTARLITVGPVSVLAGAIFERSDGRRFRALAGGATLGAATLDIPVVAVADGLAGSSLAGTALTALSGVTGSASAEVGPDGLAGGADVEDLEALRARILFRKRFPPRGGAPADYVTWASSVPGVTRVYVEPRWAGRGTVRVFPLFDDRRPNGIPRPEDLDPVRLALAAEVPAGCEVEVAAAWPFPIDIRVAGLSPDTGVVRAAVEAELADTFRRLARVSGGAETLSGQPFLATPQIWSRSWAWQAVANATGEERHSLTAPGTDLVVPTGAVPVLGSLYFEA
jgi:uncharacterized phage protein gp47/JayE